jgi:hypothetical protein
MNWTLDWTCKLWTGLVKHGLVKHGLVKHGLVKHGLVKHGLKLPAFPPISKAIFSTLHSAVGRHLAVRQD